MIGWDNTTRRLRLVQDVESEGESFCGMPQIQVVQCPAVVALAAE